MGFLSLFWCIVKIYIVCAVITLLPGIPPHAEFKEYTVLKPKSLNADLLEKRHLDKAEHIFEGQLTGPEAFAVYNGVVYTGIHGGYVVRLDEGEVHPVVRFGHDCEDITEEHICGRPLGMKFDQAGNLYVADAYYGVFKYDVLKGQKTLLVDANEVIEGKKSSLINDVAIAKDGSVYFTVTSTTFSLFEGVHAMLAPGDGRIVKYDPISKKAVVLAEGLLAPNGIALSANDDFLIVSETVAARVLKYDLKGDKKGTISIFAEGLPGLPDNIRFDGQDGFFVSLVVPADEMHPALSISLGPFPYIRKFLSRLLFLLELPFNQINKVYPNYFCRHVAHAIGHLSTVSVLSPDGVTILHLDSQGQVRDALIGRDGSVNHVSDMVVSGEYILLGSPYNNFIARVPKPNAPHHVHIKSVRFEEVSSEDKIKKEMTRQKAFEQTQARKEKQEKAREAARTKKASEEAQRRAAEEAAERQRAADLVAQRAAEDAAKQKKAAELAAQRAAEETKARLAAEEAKKRAAEEAKKRAAEVASAKREAEVAKAKRAAEEAKAREIAEENSRRLIEEAKAKKRAEEAIAKKQAEKEKAKQIAEEVKARKLAEEAKAKRPAHEKKLEAAESTKQSQDGVNTEL